MSMGNYMRIAPQRVITMAAKTPIVGIDHTTVTPTNFDPETDSEADTDDKSEQ